MIRITQKISTTKTLIGNEEISKTKYKLGKGKKLIVKTVKNANGKKELQIKKLFKKDRLLKSIMVVFNKNGHRDGVFMNVIV